MKTHDNFTPWENLTPFRGKYFTSEWPTLRQLFEITESQYGDRPCWREFVPNPVELTYSQAGMYIRNIAYWLMSEGIEPGDKVIVSGKNSVAWGAAYLGVIFAGAVAVPLDNQLSEEDFQKIARFSDSVAILADDARLRQVEGKLSFRTLASLEKKSSYCFVMDVEGVKREFPKRREDDVAQILFTSGTTGTPKGVMLTHANLVSDCFAAQANMNGYETDVFYAILPLHHAYTLLSVFIEAFSFGAEVVFGKRVVFSQMLKEMKLGHVNMLLAVPMVFNKMYKGLLDGLRKKGWYVYYPVRGLMGISGFFKKNFGVNIGKYWFKAMLEQLGLAENRVCICGGGPLPEETFKGFQQLGIDFVQGYGLTETSPITHLNPIYDFVFSSVGKPVGLTECRIENPDEDGNGRILVRGPQVMKGYYKNQEATDEILDSEEEWLDTGDVGHIDDRGYLYLTGRAKSIIVTEGGKNVFPEEIEDKFQLYADIDQVCVIGYMKDKKMKTEGVRVIIHPSKDILDSLSEEEIKEKVMEIVSEVNVTLASYKKIEMITIVSDPLPMTSTHKVKRHEVAAKYEG